jgi:hypothetical protein
MSKKSNLSIIKGFKNLLYSDYVRLTFRTHPNAFTRKRKLPFERVVLFMISMVKKSLQIELCNFTKTLNLKNVKFITNSAYNQARMKIKPELFKFFITALNDDFYTDNDERVELWKGYRLLASDSSFMNLPMVHELIERYGTSTNQHATEVLIARCSILYDLQNHMILNGSLASYKTGEREMLISQLNVIKKGDYKNLIILDRGYPSFDLAYELKKRKIDFLIRVSSNFNKDINQFINSDAYDRIIELKPGKNHSLIKKIYTRNSSITVRLVKIILDNGEAEILMTSLIDNIVYPATILKELYFKRWGIETLYDKLKNKLKVEEFTGYSHTSILQDFYCTLFLSNIQSLLVSEANEELKKQNIEDKMYEYKINTNLSIGLLKERIVDLFLNENNAEIILKELENLFIRVLIPIRPNRSYERDVGKYRKRRKPKISKNYKNVL